MANLRGAGPPVNRNLMAAVLAATATGIIVAVLPPFLRLPLLAGLLWLTVGIYVGMALMDNRRSIKVEALGGTPVLVAALLSVAWPWLLVAAWAAHPAWDLLHGKRVIKTKIHPRTVSFCLVYDVFVAVIAAGVIVVG